MDVDGSLTVLCLSHITGIKHLKSDLALEEHRERQDTRTDQILNNAPSYL